MIFMINFGLSVIIICYQEQAMLTDQCREGLNSLCIITGVPFLLINKNIRELAAFPDEFRAYYLPGFLRMLLENHAGRRDADMVLLYCVGGFYYVALSQLDTNLFLITAPISSDSLPKPSSLPYTEWCIRPGRRDDFYRFFLDLPVLGNYQLSKLAGLGRQVYNGRPAEKIVVQYKNDPKADAAVQAPEDTDPDLCVTRRQRHRPEWWKRAVYDAVKTGNEAAFCRLFKRWATGFVGRKSLNDLRQAKYSYVSFISILNRVVIEDAGVPSEEILQLSDLYIQRMDSMNSIEEIDQLKMKTGMDYCRKVMNYKGYSAYSPVTKKCCSYIREHLYEKISMGDLASAAALNRRSVSIYFKQDTGMSVSDFINIQRLEEANNLLRNTNQSISWISEVLQYSSQSYFGRKYKEYFGITPQKSRNTAR
ncbi:MAG: AraC family transcriptional regulator [Treponema sp.]|jgi:AraC-like DNA-binding protein|nr:AraC family transcriptional regulator [Treponema sp.]